ncbi:MAG: hypothetical protein M0Q90_07070 [Bacteroidales bacterium]|nr:hypothetical protein [Bacteroidales bacterium]
MLNYPPKILLAFSQTFKEDQQQFFKWLLENGYPELAALSSAIRGSEEAVNWLMKHNFFHLAALDGAIDKQQKARGWLLKFNFVLLVRLADAVNESPEAIAWLGQNELHVFLVIAQQIRDFRNRQTFDYHKKQS